MVWIILIMFVLLFCFFLILYSMEWGSIKLEEWFFFFVFFLVEFLVVFDLMKVFIIVIFFLILLINWY